LNLIGFITPVDSKRHKGDELQLNGPRPVYEIFLFFFLLDIFVGSPVGFSVDTHKIINEFSWKFCTGYRNFYTTTIN